MNDETMVYFGGACKALDDSGKVGGYLVRFGSPEATDASALRDFFTADTDFGLDVSTKSRVLYHHGLDGSIGHRSLAVGTLKVDAAGVWMECQLALRDEYERKIFEMAKAGALGLSSGTAQHLIRRERQANGSSKIVAWPLGLDASLTPTPAEPRTAAVPLKSLLPPQAKGLYLGEQAEPAAAMAALGSLGDALRTAVWGRLGDEKSPAPGRLAAIGRCLDEFKASALAAISPLLAPAAGGEATKAAGRAELEALRCNFTLIEARLAGID